MRLLLLLSLLTAAPAQAQITDLVPRDDGASDPSFLTFRGRLIEAVGARDTATVLAVLDPAIHLTFGDARGIADFRELWLSGTPPDGEPLWTVLGHVLGMGSVAHDEGFVTVPYVFGAWPDDVDPFEHGAIAGEHVRVRAAPNTEADVLATLTYTVVPITTWWYDDDGRRREWIGIRLEDGREGFVAGDYLWSAVDYRAGFEKRDGQWRMTFFIAGD